MNNSSFFRDLPQRKDGIKKNKITFYFYYINILNMDEMNFLKVTKTVMKVNNLNLIKNKIKE